MKDIDLTRALCTYFLFILASSSFVNTTDFFNSETGRKLTYQSFSGYQDVEWYFPKGEASIYYSLWQGWRKNWQDKSVPLIIWLQGGAASSQYGCFNEIGPLFIKGPKDNMAVVEHDWSWNYFGHILCVDQPVGAGFSFNNGPKKIQYSTESADHFINFLFNFFKNNPLQLANNPVYIMGESYAGHYVPPIAEKIATNKTLNIDLKGIMLGDAWVDPLNQGNNYDSFLSSVGIVSNSFRDVMTWYQNEGISSSMRGDYRNASNYINYISINDEVAQQYYMGISLFNYRQYASEIQQNYDIYLENNKKQFGVPDSVHFCHFNETMFNDFEDQSMSYKPQLQRILNLGLKVLIYNGQNDFVVPTAGVLTYLNTLEWTFAKDWRKKEKVVWKVEGLPNLGWFKNYRNFAFAFVRNAGHILPRDQPQVAWQLVNRFLTNSWY